MPSEQTLQLDTRYLAAVQQLSAGNLEEAGRLYSALLDEHPDNFMLLEGITNVLLQDGKIAEAIRHMEHALAQEPANAAIHYTLGIAQERSGHPDAAMESLARALEYQPDFPEASHALARISLPLEHYIQMLKRFHQWLRPSNYVEIGVESGESMAIAEPPTCCIGIDPEPRIEHKFSAPTRIFSETSDDFFSNHDLGKELDGKPVDLAFIDGLHHYEAALKDFNNIERYSSKETIVLIHDCIPLNKATSTRVRSTTFWSGDTWKIIPCLKHYRPDLDILTIPSPPTGLAVITHLDPTSTVLKENMHAIIDEYLPLDYDYIGKEKDSILKVMYDEWPSIQARIKMNER